MIFLTQRYFLALFIEHTFANQHFQALFGHNVMPQQLEQASSERCCMRIVKIKLALCGRMVEDEVSEIVPHHQQQSHLLMRREHPTSSAERRGGVIKRSSFSMDTDEDSELTGHSSIGPRKKRHLCTIYEPPEDNI